MQLYLNPNVSRLVCSRTGATVASDLRHPAGLYQGNPVLVEYDLTEISRQPMTPPYISTEEPGIWRYAPLLPVRGVPDSYGADVGQTACVIHEGLSREVGVQVFLKNESVNPSGSFKDRGLAVGIALGVACGARRFCLPTQGNAGVSAALFSARAGLEPAIVYMPEQLRSSIYARAARAFGADVHFFGSSIVEAGKRMRRDLERELASGATVDISTFFEPGRLEGKKTLGFEIAEAFGADALPDVILYPTGGGTGLVGIWKAFIELRALGVLPSDVRLPRMIAVQSERCAPVVRAFDAGHDDVEPVVSQHTAADGLDVPGTVMGHGILRVLRESQGGAIAVREADIIGEQLRLGRVGVSASY
ncbi:MAG TPA: pyridoxal-phosphate dependent enzyme, partial [Polyangiaceae bacterium]|nr:pyridoxal-phosphate dependent enzyme [Polyangiaceae bacterium]